jgi:23S rRNA (uracil1939-C5)-methyltransferase
VTIPLRKGEIRDIRIDDLAFGGRGVGRVEGFVVLVDGGVPGDTVRARVDRVRGSYAEGRTLDLVAPSADRVDARCEHFGTCGGCRWQNLPYDLQLEYKRRQVVEALRRIGGFPDPAVEPPLPSPDLYFYRNKMEFSFGRDAEGRLMLGLHPASSFKDVFDLNRCHLQSDASNALVKDIREGCAAAGLPPYDVTAHTGFLRYLTIREGKFTHETMVNIVTGDGGGQDAIWAAALQDLAARVAAAHPHVRSFIRSVNATRSTVAFGQRENVLHGAASIRERILGRTFEITSNSFFQTNSRQAERLYGTVLEFAALAREDRALDLYSGTGAIAILAAASAGEVRAVESLDESVRNAERNAAINAVANVFFICAEVRRALAAMARDRRPPTVVIVNPPRAGLNAAVIRGIQRLRPRRLIYVSCNPTTLARDLKQMCERDYRLDRVQPVDMFPHTWHIECVARVEAVAGDAPGDARPAA